MGSADVGHSLLAAAKVNISAEGYVGIACLSFSCTLVDTLGCGRSIRMLRIQHSRIASANPDCRWKSVVQYCKKEQTEAVDTRPGRRLQVKKQHLSCGLQDAKPMAGHS